MRKFVSLLLFVFCVFRTTSAGPHLPIDEFAKQSKQKQLVSQEMIRQPLAFTENQGQWDDKVKFRANAGGATMWFSSNGAYYQFTRRIQSKDVNLEDNNLFSAADGWHILTSDERMKKQSDSVETMMIKATFVGANPNPQMVGVEMMEYKCNYFIGNDPDQWHTNVPNYSAVLYEDIYDGIDLKYYGNGAQMEYDFIVSPGADFTQIRIQYEGAESISVSAGGELIVRTKWNEVIEQRPVIYQIENNSRIAVDGRYLIQGDNSFGFELVAYNPALALVIDPVLTYSTYLGGSSFETGSAISVDASGAAHIVGNTGSADFPTLNALQGTLQGVRGVFVTKLSNSGSSLVYSTFLGGSRVDDATDIAVDASGAAYVAGWTESTDFPTLNPIQGTFQGGRRDAFVAKLDSSGSSLVYSTYLGGADSDQSEGIAVDASGAAYVTGWTSSTDFPTLNPYQGTMGGRIDVFVSKLSGSGASLVYSTYLGGVDADFAQGIAVDASGAAYVTGGTASTDFPVVNPYQRFLQAFVDGFVSKLSGSGANLVYSTYLGGNSSDNGQGIAVDSFGAAYVTGDTRSVDFPVVNPYQRFLLGSSDAFVCKLDSSGASMVYSTFLGGSDGHDFPEDIAVDVFGKAYVTGWTESTDFPTLNPFQVALPGPRNCFVTKLSRLGASLVYSTYLGGDRGSGSGDFGEGIAVDTFGAAYIVGEVSSINFPTLSFIQRLRGPSDAFVTKFIQPLCCTTPGDYNDDGAFDIGDLTAGIARIFTPGSPIPVCWDQADADGDNKPFNIGDVTTGIARIFTPGSLVPICGTTGS